MSHRQPRCLYRIRTAALVAACLVLGTRPAGAAETRVGHLELDPHHTVVAFHLGSALHDVHGTFALRAGSLAVTPEGGAASGTIVVDTVSGESGNASRDHRMTSAILDGDHFPDIRFRAARVEGQPAPDGTFHATLYGVLTLRGADHDVAVAVDGRLTGDVLTAHARFTVPYVAWGLPDPSIVLLTVAKTVDIDVTTEGPVTWTHTTTDTTGDQ